MPIETKTTEGWFSRRPLLTPGIIAATMLLLAIGPWPYGFYTLLRLVTCGAAVVFAAYGHRTDRPGATWTFGFVALVFNPLIPVHLSREMWQPIDIGAAMLFLITAAAMPRQQTSAKAAPRQAP